MPSSGPSTRFRGSARPWPRRGSVESSTRASAAGTPASSPSPSGTGLELKVQRYQEPLVAVRILRGRRRRGARPGAVQQQAGPARWARALPRRAGAGRSRDVGGIPGAVPGRRRRGRERLRRSGHRRPVRRQPAGGARKPRQGDLYLFRVRLRRPEHPGGRRGRRIGLRRQLPGRARLFHRAGRAVHILGRPRRKGGRPFIYGVGGYGACPGTPTFQERAAFRCCEAAGTVIQDRGDPNDDRRPEQQPIRSTIPARLDRLRWSPFHTRLVLGLGTAWVLDGLSITIASSVPASSPSPTRCT